MRPLALNSQISSMVIRNPDTVKKVDTPRKPPLAQPNPAWKSKHRGDGHPAQAVEAREGRDGGALLHRFGAGRAIGRAGAQDRRGGHGHGARLAGSSLWRPSPAAGDAVSRRPGLTER